MANKLLQFICDTRKDMMSLLVKRLLTNNIRIDLVAYFNVVGWIGAFLTVFLINLIYFLLKSPQYQREQTGFSKKKK